MKIGVSILIPIYKVPKDYLIKCIDSCIKQSMKSIEIILVDDGSPDHCGRICDDYALKDSRIKVIHKENRGLAAARNTAFDVAEGEFIMFLDGDDYLEENACERTYEVAKQKNVQLVLFNGITEFANSSVLTRSFADKELEFFGNQCKGLQLRVLDFNGGIAQVFRKLINRTFLKKNKIRHVDELRQGAEGFVFNIMLFEHLESAYYIPDALLHYIHNENSISHTYNEENNYLVVKCFDYVYKYIQHCENKPELTKMLYNRMLYVVCTTAITGYFNPENREPFKDKVMKFEKWMELPLIKNSLQTQYSSLRGVCVCVGGGGYGLSYQRRFILKCIKLKQYWIISILAIVRRKQLQNR